MDENKREDSYHDFMVERKWLVTIMGFGKLSGFRHIAYIVVIFVFLSSLFAINVYGAFLASGEKSLLSHALHVLLVIVFGTWGLVTRVLTDEPLDRIRKYLKGGVYLYDGEDFLDEQVKMKETVVEEIRVKSRDFVAVWLLAAVTICLFFPITQVFMVSDEEYEKVVEIANPYLPAFFYMPFSTRTPIGFMAAYLIGVVAYFYIIGYGMLLNEFYLSIIMQLRVQLEILNYSIRNIHKRAILMYSRLKRIPYKEMSLDDVYQDSDYQKCLIKCLRSNIQHHQLLLRFNKEFFKYSGSILLLVFNIAAMVFALNVYIIMQNPALNISIKCLITFLAEQMFALYYCVFGEIIMNESGNLFTSLYSTSWYYYSKAFNQNLQVFMCYTMKPMRVKAIVLDLTASLETFANELGWTEVERSMMQTNNSVERERIFHDFMIERKWLVHIVGFGPSKSKLYTAYIIFMFVYLYGHLAMNLYGIVMIFGDKNLVLHALHMLVVIIFTSWGITTRVFTDKALTRIRKNIQDGFYEYEGEELLEEQLKIREEVVHDIRNKSSDFVSAWLTAGFTICIVFPVTQIFTVTDEYYEKVVDVANPYLPAFFYMPFSTRTPYGFIFAYILAVLVYFCCYGYGMIMNEFYLSILLQLRAQLKILNYSIRHIHKRAILMYATTKGIPKKEMLLDEVYHDTDYQNCLTKCLRSNIQHHQLLMRFHNDFIKYSGSLIFMVFILAANVFALSFYMAVQDRSLNSCIRSFINLCAEQIYVLYMCIFGEIIMNESSTLFTSIYSVPWFYYNKNFNKSLQMFMISTMKPMKVRALVLDLTASLEAYANSILWKHRMLMPYIGQPPGF